MILSDVEKIIEDVKVYRDGIFEGLGLAVASPGIKLMTFIEKVEYLEGISDDVSCIICKKEIAGKIPDRYGVLISNKPRIDYFTIHNILSHRNMFNKKRFKSKIGKGCNISPNSVIRENNVIIGNNVTIEEFVVIEEGTVIQDNCIIRSGAKIGGTGFEFKRNNEEMMSVSHAGGVILKKNVEIQYNTCIDRGLYHWDNTIIGENTKLDNLIYIAHGVKIGERCLIAANATIGGRTVIGNDCWIGLSATIANGLKIGEKCKINMGAAVTKNVEAGLSMSGNFAIEHNRFIKYIKDLSKRI